MLKTDSLLVLLPAIACIAFASTAHAQEIRGMCVSNCNIPAPPSSTPQPSAEDLRRQSEAVDLREAADDAQDRGVRAYRQGNYSEAVRWLSLAASYAPDDQDIAQNLAQARQRNQTALASTAAREANAAAQAETQAPAIFDGRRGARDAGAVSVSPSTAIAGSVQRTDPVVPDSRMTPAIATLQRQREDLRVRVAAIETEVRTLNPAMHAERIARRRQERSQAEDQVNFVNFNISEALRAPSASRGPTPAGN